MAIETGNYISKDLSFYIQKFTHNSELIDASDNNNLSTELGRLIVSRKRKVTDNNLPLILDIVRIAIVNRGKTHRRLLKGHREAEKSIA